MLPELVPNVWSIIANAAFALGAIFVSTFLITSSNVVVTTGAKSTKREPPGIPYWIPYCGNVFSLSGNSDRFFSSVMAKHGSSTPVRVRLGPVKFYLVAGAEHIAVLFKASKGLSPRFGVLLSLENLFGTPSDVIPFYKMDNSGTNTVPNPESNVRPADRLNFFQVKAAQKHLNGAGLAKMTEHFLKVLRRRIDESRIGNQWIDMPDLFTFIQHEVFNAAVEALTGKYFLAQYPEIVEDFWEFDRSVPTLIKGLPQWLTPRPYRVRQRLLDAVKSWHRIARENSDFTKDGPEDPEWDPYWGSKLMRARQSYSSGVHFMNEDALAAEDLGLIFAMNTNAVPAVAWFLIEFYRDSILLSRARAEVEAARRPTPEPEQAELDITKLCSSPLLQSAYAETLRLRVALVITRTPEHEDFHMGNWTFPKNRPIVFSSRSAAMDPEVWNAGTANDPHPLDRFWADRFLIDPNDPTSGPSRKDPDQTKQQVTNSAAEGELKAKPYFSMENVAGGWVPYGGGQRMCPGRHFAKQEIIGTFATLLLHYDIELLTAKDWEPQPDMNFFPFGGLPPVGKIPFRIRRKRG
ncbi:MAG: hypothetical protein Q9173_000057 [Seirophora scorigena]